MSKKDHSYKLDDLAKVIVTHQENLDRFNKLAKKEKRLLQANEEELLLQMNEQGVKTYESHELLAKVTNRNYVDVYDEDVVPMDFKVSLGFRIDKMKIHRIGECPIGCDFRTRQTLKVSKKE